MPNEYKNPVVMFGNIGPDVVRLSQIYDPDNDQYKPSDDQYAVLTPKAKKYWIRTYADKVVKFTPVTGITSASTPKANGWYDENTNGIVSTGKYVPAEQSLVVVDVDNETFKENMLLTVESVDDEITIDENGVRRYPTFKSTLVPVHYGTGTETSARALDYGNDRLMLYFDRIGDNEGNVRLRPDRKLLLYGDKIYAYRIVRSNGEVLSSNKKTEEGTAANEGYVPYIGALSEYVTITPDDFKSDKYAGRTFTVFHNSRIERFDIAASINGSANTALTISVDEYYRKDRTYWKLNSNGSLTMLLPPDSQYIGDSYHYGDTVGDVIRDGTETSIGAANVLQFQSEIFKDSRTGWLDHDSSKRYLYYPSECWLQAPKSTPLTAGEVVTLETYEYNMNNDSRLIMSTKLVVREGTTIDASRMFTKSVARFDVKLVDSDDSDTFVLSQRGSVNELASKLYAYIVYDNGDKEFVPIDNRTCFCYGLEAISTATPDRVYNLLFKYFRNVATNPNSNTPKTFMTCTKRVLIANDAASTVRRISLVPCWNYKASRYVFKYLIYDTTFNSPEFRDNLDTITRSDDTADAINFTNCFYKDSNGFIRSSASPASTYDYVQRGDIAIFVRADGYANSVYTQTIGLKLQSWVEGDASTSPVKWLIGDDKESTYSASVLKYGNVADIRPYLNFYRDTDGTELFQIGKAFINTGDVGKVIKAFYKNAWAVDNTPETPTHVRFRGLGTYTHYDNLSSDKALRGVKYYNDAGIEVPVNAGDDVTDLYVRCQDDLTYYTKSSVGDKYTEVPAAGLPKVGSVIDVTTRESLYLKYVDPVQSDYISLSTSSSEWRRQFKIPGAKSVVDIAEDTTGGTIPSVVDTGADRWNMQVMGVVVAEFSILDKDGTHRHLYGAPVEVRWPYVVTQAATYGDVNSYYMYDDAAGRFVVIESAPADDSNRKPNLPYYKAGDTIPHEDGVRAVYVQFN